MCRFRKEWLKFEYSSKEKVESAYADGLLTDTKYKALLGVHKRHHSLADDPSELDLKTLAVLGYQRTQGII